MGHEPAVIRITASYLKTVGEGPDGELTFCSSAKIKVPKVINLLPPRANETLTEVKTKKFRDVTCAKYKLVTPRLTIDGVRAAPE